jgi:quercetin dioxygenase-like cupin family protein
LNKKVLINGRLVMKTVDVEMAEVSENPHGVDAKRIYDEANAQAVHILLKPGESLKKHVTPVDVFFYVLEGAGQVEVGEEKERVTADTLVESPSGIPHRLINDTEEDFRVLVVKAPRPDKPTRLL